MGHGARWSGDDRGRGVGDASVAAPALRELLELAHRPDWVAEEPEAHLGDHLRRAADELGLVPGDAHTSDDGSFRVTLSHDPTMNKRAVRVAVWGVVAAIAETTTHVREHPGPDGTEFHVVTGTTEDAGQFAPHGHLLVLRVVPSR